MTTHPMTWYQRALVALASLALLLSPLPARAMPAAEPVADPAHALGTADAQEPSVTLASADDMVLVPAGTFQRGCDPAHNGDVIQQPGAAADPDFGADDTERTDLDIVVQFGLRIHLRFVGNAARHSYAVFRRPVVIRPHARSFCTSSAFRRCPPQ